MAQTDSLNILWDPNTDPDIFRYLLQRSVNSTGDFQNLEYVFHPNTHVVDRTVQPGNLYAYRVAAIDSSGNISPFTAPVAVGLPGISLHLSTLPTGRDTSFALGDILTDPDHNLADLIITISQEDHVSAAVSGGNLVLTPVPIGYTGPASFTMRVEDPDGFFDLQLIAFQYGSGAPGGNFTLQVPDIAFDEDGSYSLLMDTTVSHPVYPPDQISYAFSPGPDLQASYDPASRVVTITSRAANWNGQDVVVVTATDPDQVSVSDTFLVTIHPVNDPPITSIQRLFISQNPDSNLIDLTQYAIDVDDDVLSLDWSFWNFNHFDIVWHDPGQKIIRIIPLDTTRSESGFFRVADPQNAADTAVVTIEVLQNPNEVFLVQIPDQTFPEDGSRTIHLDTTVSHTGYPPSAIQWSFLAGADLTYTFDANTRRLTVRSRTPDWFGQDEMIAVATDPDQLTVRDTFLVNITPVNDPPTISVQTLFVSRDPDSNLIDLTQYAVDVDNTPLQLTWSFGGFSDFDIVWEDQGQRIVRIIPQPGATSETGQFIVADPEGAADTADVTITVSGEIVFTVHIPDARFEEDQQFSIHMDTTVTISHYPPNQLTWQFFAGPELSYAYDAANRKLTLFSRVANWFGQEEMVAVATAPDQTTRADTFQVIIDPVNDPPRANIHTLFVSPASNNLFDLTLYASDVDHPVEQLDWDFWGFGQFTVEWFDHNQRIVRIVPQPGATSETGFFRVYDPEQAADTAQVTLVFVQNNTPPRLLVPNRLTLAEDSTITLNLVNLVIDSTNNAGELTWSFEGDGNLILSHDPQRQRLSIAPLPDWYGESNMLFRVTDPEGLMAEKVVTVVVERRNDIENIVIRPLPGDEVGVTVQVQVEIPSQLDLSYWYTPFQITTITLTQFQTEHTVRLANLVSDTTYHFRLRITDEDGHTLSLSDSTFQTGGGRTGVPPPANAMIVYPNPVKPALGHREVIFLNLPPEAHRIALYSLAGDRIYDGEISQAQPVEYRINIVDGGVRFPSGLYIYMVKDEQSRVLKRGKIVIIQ